MKQARTLGVLDLLALRGFETEGPAKIVRHQSRKHDVHDLLRRGWLEAYQGFQSRPVFDDCDFIVSFVGEESTKARLIGVYRVVGRRSGRNVPLPPGCPYREWRKSRYFCKLKREKGYEDLENRLIIEWGKGNRGDR